MLKGTFRKNRIWWIPALICTLVFCLAGCGAPDQETSDGSILLYYLNSSQTGLATEEYELKSEETEEQIAEVLGAVSSLSTRSSYQSVLPKDVKIESTFYSNHQLYLYFNGAYYNMNTIRELLCRGGLVSVLLQLPEVDGVSFYIENLPLENADGTYTGIMTDATFMQEQANGLEESKEYELSLYFANSAGNRLVQETRKVSLQNNVQTCRQVIDELMKGPESEDLQKTIPDAAGLIDISVLDGVCYVNFDNGFLENDYNITEDSVIYSIVNSLIDLPGINLVKISVDSNSNITYRNQISLNLYFEKNSDMVLVSR